MKQGTICVQGAYRPKNGEPRVLPIVQSTTYKYESSEEMGDLFDLKKSGYFYSRLQNPTNDKVAEKITMLEGGVAGMLTSSGQSANFYAVLNIAGAGDHIVSSSAIYGGTYNLFNVTLRKLGIDFTFVSPDATEEEIQAAFKPRLFSAKLFLTQALTFLTLSALQMLPTKTVFLLLLTTLLQRLLIAEFLNGALTLLPIQQQNIWRVMLQQLAV